MLYHLCQVEDRLKQAYSRAIQQIDAGASEFSDLRSQKLEPDIGHEPAIKQANMAPVLANGKGLRWQEGNRFRRGELKGRMTIIGNPADFNQKRVWTIHVSDQQEYPIFLLRAQLYLTLRGIPHSLQHKTASRLIRTSGKIGGASWTRLTIQEEALEFARIPLNEPDGFKDVEPSLGIIKSPETGNVIKAFIATPPPSGMHRVYPGDKLFLLEVWTTPSMKKDLLVNAPVGGLVERVQVKAGSLVWKDQELVRLRDPFEKDPWPYNKCSIP